MEEEITVVAGLCIEERGVLIQRRAKLDSSGGLWEFPGGKVEAQESFVKALGRELHEELGVFARVGDEIFQTRHVLERVVIQLHVFRVDMQKQDPRSQEVGCECRWVRREELGGFEFLAADIGLVGRVIKGEF